MSHTMKCDNCAYCWKSQIDPKTLTKQLVCRRYPPLGFPVGPNQVIAIFPPLNADMYCGEWAPDGEAQKLEAEAMGETVQ